MTTNSNEYQREYQKQRYHLCNEFRKSVIKAVKKSTLKHIQRYSKYQKKYHKEHREYLNKIKCLERLEQNKKMPKNKIDKIKADLRKKYGIKQRIKWRFPS